MLKVVDFPDPLGPNNPNISPFFTPKLLFLIAVNPLGYYLESLVTLTISSQLGSANLSYSSFTSGSISAKSSSILLRLGSSFKLFFLRSNLITINI